MSIHIIQSQRRILDSLIAWESSISDLYNLFTKRSRNAEYWTVLAREERSHAALLTTLQSFLEQGHLFWNLGRFNESMVQDQIQSIQLCMEEAKKKLLAEDELLRVALGVEKSLLESRFYSDVQSDCPTFKSIAHAMVRATERHLQKIKNMLVEQGGGPDGG